MKTLLKIFKVLLIFFIVIGIAGVSYLKFGLPNIEPTPEITIEPTPERIERGKYLSNHVSVCMDCHSSRDWTLFSAPPKSENWGAGGEKFTTEEGFPGNFYAKNITPAALGSWTDGEIVRAITTGVSKDGQALFPVMPYHSFGKMDQEDIYSIVAYLRTLPAVEHQTPERSIDFPVNLIINTMPAPAQFMPKPDPSQTLAYGKYLVMAASCVDCHSNTKNGQRIPGSEFGGGMEFKYPAGITRSANITPDTQTGIGNWDKRTFVDRFKAYQDSTFVLPKIGPQDLNSPMPWVMYAGLSNQDLEAMFTYLQSLQPIKNQVVKFEHSPK